MMKAFWSELKGSYKKLLIWGGLSAVVGIVILVMSLGGHSSGTKEAAVSTGPASQQQINWDEINARNAALIENLKVLRAALRERGPAETAPAIPVADDSEIIKTIKSEPDEVYWIPLGTTILVELQNRLVSSLIQTPVVAFIPYTMRLDEYKTIEKGSRFIGTSQANYDQQRVLVHFHHMVTTDFKEVEIDGDALDPYGSGGLTGTYHSNDLERLLSMFGLNLVGAVADINQEHKESMTGVPFRRLTAQNIFLDGTSKTTKQESERILQEMASHKDEKIEVKGRSYLKIFFNRGFYSHATH